jgi:hypothetical protein
MSFAAGPAVDDVLAVEVPWLAVFDGPGLHPRTTSDKAARTAPKRRERDVLRMPPS